MQPAAAAGLGQDAGFRGAVKTATALPKKEPT